MDSDDAIRSGSADSENSSDNSYVQVTQEEATLASQEATEGGEATTSFPKTPAVDDEEDIYGAEEDEEPPQEESAPLEQEQVPGMSGWKPYRLQEPLSLSLVPRPFLSLKIKIKREKIGRKGLGKWPTPRRSTGISFSADRNAIT